MSPRKRDTGRYYFQLDRGSGRYSNQNDSLFVQVTELTELPDIRVQEPLQSGSPSRLTCSLPGACDGVWAPTISWRGAALGPSGVYEAGEIQLTPRPQDHNTNLTCRVAFPGTGPRRERTLRLQVSYPPQSLTIHVCQGNCTGPEAQGNGSSRLVPEGAALCLVCVADSNPPSRLTWAWRSRALNPLKPSGPGVLELPGVQWDQEGELTCLAKHPRGNLSASIHLSVFSTPHLQGLSCSWEKEVLHCSCSFRAWPAPALRWQLGDYTLVTSNDTVQVTTSSGGPWANSTLSLHGGLGASLRLSCEARNAHGERRAGVLLMPGKRELGGGFVLGSMVGAGVAGLLALCLYLTFFLVKTCRKKAPKRAAGLEEAPSTRQPHVSWDNQLKCPPSSQKHPPSPAWAALTPAEKEGEKEKEEEEEEVKEEEKGEEKKGMDLHYASLSFLELRPLEPPGQDALNTTEYSEIKTKQ